MKIFGLLSVLIATALGAWWMVSSMGSSYDETGVKVDNSEEVIDLSREAAEKIAESVRTSKQISVYDGITIPSHAREVNLSGRGLSGSLKAEVRHLTELRELNLSNNKFTGLPAEIGQLSELRILNLSNNPLTGLPHELGNLQKLEVLNLTGTDYSKFDLEIISASLPQTVQILVD